MLIQLIITVFLILVFSAVAWTVGYDIGRQDEHKEMNELLHKKEQVNKLYYQVIAQKQKSIESLEKELDWKIFLLDEEKGRDE